MCTFQLRNVVIQDIEKQHKQNLFPLDSSWCWREREIKWQYICSKVIISHSLMSSCTPLTITITIKAISSYTCLHSVGFCLKAFLSHSSKLHRECDRSLAYPTRYWWAIERLWYHHVVVVVGLQTDSIIVWNVSIDWYLNPVLCSTVFRVRIVPFILGRVSLFPILEMFLLKT